MNNTVNFFNELYSWFSAVAEKRTHIDEESLSRFFEPDFAMIVNGRCLVKNRQMLKAHLQSLIEAPGEIKIILPFLDLLIQPPKVAIRYQIRFEYENQATLTQVAGFYLLSDNHKASAKWEVSTVENLA